MNPNPISEGGGANASTGRVTRSGDTTSALVVNLASSRGEVTLPATVTIAAGQSSASFQIGVAENTLVDGTRSATISARRELRGGQAQLGINFTTVSFTGSSRSSRR